MSKDEAFWELNTIYTTCQLTSRQREAISIAQELLESEDLLSEAFELGELEFKNKN